MARKSTLLAIPTLVLEELKSRSVNQPCLTIDCHHAWLTGQGFIVSRSALGRYLKNIKKEGVINTPILNKVDKLSCLMIASKYTDNKNDLLKLSSELLDWVQNSD